MGVPLSSTFGYLSGNPGGVEVVKAAGSGWRWLENILHTVHTQLDIGNSVVFEDLLHLGGCGPLSNKEIIQLYGKTCGIRDALLLIRVDIIRRSV